MDRCSRWGEQERDRMEIFLGVTPFLVNHETHSSTFGFTGLSCSVHPLKQRSYQTALQQCPGPRFCEPCFRQTKDVTVPYVPLETYPGSKIIHLILQRLDIGKQNARLEEDCELFSSVCCESQHVSHCVLDPSPRVAIQVAIVHLHVPKNLEWPRWVGG